MTEILCGCFSFLCSIFSFLFIFTCINSNCILLLSISFLIALFNGFVMVDDDLYRRSAIFGKTSMPSPHKQAGKILKIFLSSSFILFLPVIVGIVLYLMMSSIGRSSRLMFFVVLARYVHLLLMLCVNAQKAACSWQFHGRIFHDFTIKQTFAVLNSQFAC